MVVLLSNNSVNQSGDYGRTGVLTDGLKWSFYHNEDTVWYNTILWTRDDTAALRVLRICLCHISTNIRYLGVFSCWKVSDDQP
jgi:hypothetical protein